MRRGHLARAGAASALLAAAAAMLLPVNSARSEPVLAGVTTHFAQGWPLRLLPVAQELGVQVIRDSVHWAAVEKVRGRYDFTITNSGHIDRACASGLKVLLGIEPRSPLYDGGQTAYSEGARSGFAAYVKALADRWPSCVIAVEIGNEINGEGGMKGPAATDRVAAHVALVRAVRAAVKSAHPSLALLGGSTNTIATGFLARLFRAGLLDVSDGIAVHPYRDDPEGAEREIARLRAAMRRAGAEKPIWATEFSREFARPEDAAPFYLKMAALMEAAGVRAHLWYALADQPGFPTMGLVRFNGSKKPAAHAFAFARQTLAPRGPAVRIDHGDPALYDFAYGSDIHVIWGALRAFDVRAAAGSTLHFFRADGAPAAPPREVDANPLVIVGAAELRFGPAMVLADSFYGFGEAPLSWWARTGDGRMLPLNPVDWTWSGYLGNPALPAAVVNPRGIGASPALASVVRYVAAAPGPVTASACLSRKGPGGPMLASIERDGAAIWSGPVGAAPVALDVPVTARPGTRIDLVIAAPAGSTGGRLHYRFRVTAGAPATPSPCAEEQPR